MQFVRTLFLITALSGLLAVPAMAELQLPLLGDASSGMITPQQEYDLGRNLLRLYRSHLPTSSDPQIIEYLEELLAKLAQHSQLQDRRLELVLVESDTLNAFAAPGGIVGVNTGLLTYTHNEHQLASVLAHELAHLSQRHYARRLEQQKNMTVPLYTALLGSLILAAAAGGDAGMAAIMSTQAAAQSSQLRFSRQNEQEADRIGIQTMVNAGMDPNAAAGMFELMLRSSRYSRRPPEFLLTHPVTESRISDARNRAMRYPQKQYEDNLEFHLMRARIRVQHTESPQLAVRRFRGELEGDNLSPAAARYGLSLALSRAGQFDEALKTLQPLLESEPNRATYQLLKTEIQVDAQRYEPALATLAELHARYPGSHAVNVRYGESLMKAGKFEESTAFLERYSRQRGNDPYVWYLLAEVSGLAGDILRVHEARAEYFILMGNFGQAQVQLRNALRHTRGNNYRTVMIEERIRTVERMQQASRF